MIKKEIPKQIQKPSDPSSKMSEPDTVDPNEINTDDLQQFKLNVNKWCELDNKIKQYEQVVKAHKKIKDELCSSILKFMDGYEISNLKTPFGQIEKVESETKVAVTKVMIEERVQNYFSKLGFKNSKEQSQTLIKDLYDNREKKKVVRLKRIAPKEPKPPKAPKEQKVPKKTKVKDIDGSTTSKKSIVPDSLKKI